MEIIILLVTDKSQYFAKPAKKLFIIFSEIAYSTPISWLAITIISKVNIPIVKVLKMLNIQW